VATALDQRHDLIDTLRREEAGDARRQRHLAHTLDLITYPLIGTTEHRTRPPHNDAE
jgi:hypothetical protein